MTPLSNQLASRLSSESASRPATVAFVDLAALASNLRVVRDSIGERCQVLAVVKADAYGHGAPAVAQALLSLGVKHFAVATLSEGVVLREARISAPVLVMGGIQPEDYPTAWAYRLTPVLYDASQLPLLARCVPRRLRPYPVHLKIDTGMARLGLSPEELADVLASPEWGRTLMIEGLMTHLADADGADPAYTHRQLQRFGALLAVVEKAGIRAPLIHAANSAAILRHPSARFTAVRPGIMLYGYHTLAGEEALPALRPALSWTTKVVQVRAVAPGDSVSYNRAFVARRPLRVAVLPVGYADGYSRALSNRGAVLIQGFRAPIVGRICMDLTMVDVTACPDVRPGTDAVLLGAQEGGRITADDLAAWVGTIPYEILCAVGPRVPRIYLPASSPTA